MAIRKIREEGDEILKKKSREIEEIDDRILELLDDMVETMHKYNGVGLAAVQVGVLKRAIVIDLYDDKGPIKLINPVIVKEEGEQEVEEGCLSFPNKYAKLIRPAKVTVEALNEKGKKVKKAGPSTPVEIMGLTEVPQAGDTFYEVKDEKTAKHLIEKRKRQERENAINAGTKVTLDNLFSQMEEGNLKVLNLIVKADVQGSVEAIKQSMEKLSNEEVRVKVIHAAAGAVTETDVTLAKVSNAIIIAFNVRPMPTAKDMAEKEEVEIKQYSIIYQAIDDVQAAMKGMLAPKYQEKVIGNAEIRQTFKISNVGTIGGAYVLDGKLERNAGVRVLRDNVVIHDGKLASLKRFKDDAKEVSKGFECGIQIEKFNDIKEGDILEAYIMEEIKR